MKWMLIGLLALNSLWGYDVDRADQITYEWLVNEGDLKAYSDHIAHFKFLFDRHKVRTFLEFGLGYSTAYFLERCHKVISIEFITHGYGPQWMQYSVELFREASNWVPIAYFSGFLGDTNWARYKYVGSEAVYRACSYQCATHQNYALQDDFYLTELNAFLKNLVRSNKPEVAFVDAGLVLRGDLVTLMFGKVPIIVAHDTAWRGLKKPGADVYGYTRIETPDTYEEIYLDSGAGTTLWVVKKPEYEGLRKALWEYSQGL